MCEWWCKQEYEHHACISSMDRLNSSTFRSGEDYNRRSGSLPINGRIKGSPSIRSRKRQLPSVLEWEGGGGGGGVGVEVGVGVGVGRGQGV